uniref:Ependymin-related protein n=1 Tax=Stichopus japonicus TaxID=307972 RepID=Q106Q2_STIJA|nr:ependymin-related protein precursor [Apostichopus japonicus]
MIRVFILLMTVGAVLGTYIIQGNTAPTLTRVNTGPKPCQTIPQWEGRASEWNHITESNNRYIISFDGVGLRKRVLKEAKSFMPGERQYNYIMEFKTNTLYTINLNLNTCTVTNLTQPWQNHTIPTDATLEDEYELGAPGSGFRVREWSDRLPARRAESWIGIFTIASCWPIVEVFTDDEPQNPVSLTTRFFDLTPGIANMSVFDPPEICKNQTVHPEPEFEPELEFDPPITYQYFNVTIDDDKDSGPVNSFFKKGWNYFKSLF